MPFVSITQYDDFVPITLKFSQIDLVSLFHTRAGVMLYLTLYPVCFEKCLIFSI